MQFIAQNYVKIIYRSNYKRYFRCTNNPVFITFVKYNRREILLSNIELLRNSFKHTLSKYQFEIIAISILKEHCHLIISANNPNDIPNIIRAIKYHFHQMLVISIFVKN